MTWPAPRPKSLTLKKWSALAPFVFSTFKNRIHQRKWRESNVHLKIINKINDRHFDLMLSHQKGSVGSLQKAP